MKALTFAKRNLKELLRDPISLVFCIGLPVFLLFLISTIQKSVAVEIFKIENFAPGIAIFSFAFITMFSSMLVSKDRSTSFLLRLFASPMKSSDFILGYSLPLVLIALIQSIVCFGVAMAFGLAFNLNLVLTIVVLIPISFLFIGLGVLLGCLFNDKQASGVVSILIQVAALSSGMWFDLSMIGGTLKTICYILPFAHALNVTKGVLSGSLSGILTDIWWVLGYTVIIVILSIIVFNKKMKSGNI